MHCTLVLCLALFAPAASGAAVPSTPAGNTFAAWLDALNSGDRARLTSFVAKYEPERNHAVESMLDLRDRSGGFTLLRIEKSEPRHLEALLKEREAGNYAVLQIEVTDAEPATVKGIQLRPAPRPADEPAVPRLSFEEAARSLDSEAADLTSKDKFSGDVLVARLGKIALEKSYGLANRETHAANALNTRFRIGSMNKMFTATAILQLVASGKIDLGAPLGKYLPDYPNKDAAAKVTIRHLLTHTGGTGDIFTPEYDQQRLEISKLTDYLKLFGTRGLQFEPGSAWAYSNYGFVLLGMVVERVSGTSYYDYVRTHIFLPAGMHDTDSLPESEAVPNRSTGYMKKNGAWVSNTDTLPWRASSAGGGYSTVRDLFHFAQALLNGRLLTPDLFAQMTSKQAGSPQMPPNEGYGFGMMVTEEPQGNRFGHGGGAPGMNVELRVYPRTQTIVVVLANLDPPAATRLAESFDARMPLE